jgi:probable rRNA maturation factor
MPDPAEPFPIQNEPATVTYEQLNWRLKRTELRHMAEQLSARVAGGLGFSCYVASGEALRKLNRDFRGKDESTDVLSFPSGAAQGAGFLGDLAISIEHARVQAQALGHSVEQEIGVLMLHGVLHLMGMDHETDRGQMRRSEARWRRTFGLPASLTERGSLKLTSPALAKPVTKTAVKPQRAGRKP